MISDLPYFFRLPEASCNCCGRSIWDGVLVGSDCQLMQSDGSRCGGSYKTPDEMRVEWEADDD